MKHTFEGSKNANFQYFDQIKDHVIIYGPDFSKINLIFIFYTLFRTCMQKSADDAYIYITFFEIFVFEDQSCFLQKSVTNFLVPDFGKTNHILFFYTLFRTCMQKSADGVSFVFFSHLFFCKKARPFFGTEIGHDRLWPLGK